MAIQGQKSFCEEFEEWMAKARSRFEGLPEMDIDSDYEDDSRPSKRRRGDEECGSMPSAANSPGHSHVDEEPGMNLISFMPSADRIRTGPTATSPPLPPCGERSQPLDDEHIPTPPLSSARSRDGQRPTTSTTPPGAIDTETSQPDDLPQIEDEVDDYPNENDPTTPANDEVPGESDLIQQLGKLNVTTLQGRYRSDDGQEATIPWNQIPAQIRIEAIKTIANAVETSRKKNALTYAMDKQHCLSKVTQSKTSIWHRVDGNLSSCKSCTNAKNICVRLTSDALYVLPLPRSVDLRNNHDYTALAFWKRIDSAHTTNAAEWKKKK